MHTWALRRRRATVYVGVALFFFSMKTFSLTREELDVPTVTMLERMCIIQSCRVPLLSKQNYSTLRFTSFILPYPHICWFEPLLANF